MSDTLVTVVGNVATRPEMKQSSMGVPYVRFRLASTERRFDRAEDRWTDGRTSFYTVWAWRALGENVAASVGIGEPVVVHGKLRVVEREEKGQTFVSVAIDAASIGHDMTRGTSAFRRMAKARPELAEPPADLEPSRSSPSSPSSPSSGKAADSGPPARPSRSRRSPLSASPLSAEDVSRDAADHAEEEEGELVPS